jgi:integral membrane sensor domain MASE1
LFLAVAFAFVVAFVLAVAFVFAVILNAVKDPEESNPQQPLRSFSHYIPPSFLLSPLSLFDRVFTLSVERQNRSRLQLRESG